MVKRGGGFISSGICCGAARLHASPIGRQAAGFTLLELLITVSIVAILIAVTAPSFVDSVRQSQRSATLSDIAKAVDLARVEAASRSETILLCSSEDGAVCSGDASWEQGFAIITAVGGDVLHLWGASSGNVTLRTQHFDVADRVIFAPDGTVTASGTFTVCDETGAREASGLVVNVSGLTRLSVDGPDSGTIVEDNLGADVVCPT